MEVQEILTAWLRANGYDGLYNDDGECGCLIGGLAPCESCCLTCKPGVRISCPGEDECQFGGGCAWHIVQPTRRSSHRREGEG